MNVLRKTESLIRGIQARTGPAGYREIPGGPMGRWAGGPVGWWAGGQQKYSGFDLDV